MSVVIFSVCGFHNFQEIIPFHIGPKKYKWGSEMSNLVNPNLKKKEVDIYDEEIQTAAEKIGTIADELMTRINKRVQRRYV